MTVANNPAARLYDVLAPIFSDAAGRNRQESIGAALSDTLQVQSSRSVLQELGYVHSLVTDVYNAFADAELDPDAWVDPWAGDLLRLVDRVAQQGLNVTLATLADEGTWLTEKTLMSMKAAGQYLSKHSSRQALTDDQLSEIRMSLADLRERLVAANDVSAHLRKVLLDYLRQMERVLDHVLLLGPEGLADVAATGVTILLQEMTRESGSEADREAASRLKDVLVRVKAWVGLGRNAANLAIETAHDTQKMIESARDLI